MYSPHTAPGDGWSLEIHVAVAGQGMKCLNQSTRRFKGRTRTSKTSAAVHGCESHRQTQRLTTLRPSLGNDKIRQDWLREINVRSKTDYQPDAVVVYCTIKRKIRQSISQSINRLVIYLLVGATSSDVFCTTNKEKSKIQNIKEVKQKAFKVFQ